MDDEGKKGTGVPAEIQTNIRNCFLKCIPGIDQIPNPQLTFEMLPSFANFVYKVTIRSDGAQDNQSNRTYVYKQFRQYLEEFSSKVVENQVVTKLSELNLYPKVIEADGHHRIEEFVQGRVPSVSTISKEKLIEVVSRLGKMTKIFPGYGEGSGQNKRQIKAMFKIYEKVAAECSKLHPDAFSECKQIIEWMLQPGVREKIQSVVSKVMVPTHNDVHFHNVIIGQDDALYIVDYEFFALNYRGFELGNFFNQYATDYESFQIRSDLELPENMKEQLIKTYYTEIEGEVSQQQAKREVQVGRLLSHLFWFFIGVKQIKDPNIPIDMKYYVKRRYEEFLVMFNEICGKL